MSAILVFLAGIFGIVGWWLARQRLTSKPWLEAERGGDLPDMQRSPLPTAKIGLGIFLAVVCALFTLLISAYLTRMGSADWWGMPVPRLLWANTAVLLVNGASLEWAKVEARLSRSETLNTALAMAFGTGFLFLLGQLLVWWQLVSAGYVLADNPANSFFYMITGIHGLHIIGGLFVLGRTTVRARSNFTWPKMRLSVDLCATYWHVMLIIWLVMFALFAGWVNSFADLCRQLVT
jgi:cytochrome c oxidase subunit 3